ncbi:transcription factor CP2 and related proteins [Entomortierella parvispora]|uniref:Transcription factor CP2 and related proteins n=1 Tax=Entomortierella parvispora TaxID=205924 RepID=A0A9P3LSH3_9FUNG|nr:transcription factor CP2 and related proteins [Entomortierella parvispora]
MNRNNHQQQHHPNQQQQHLQQQSGPQYQRGSSPPGSYSNNYNNSYNNMHYQQYQQPQHQQQQQQQRQQHSQPQQYGGNSYGGNDQNGQTQHGGSQQHQQHQQHQLQQQHHQQQQNNPQEQQRQQQHQQQQQQKGGGQAAQDRSTASVSDGGSSPPRSEVEGSNLRFKITLEAQTAAMQRQEETPVTYLNKGQFYTVALEDSEQYDGDITSVIKVTFHDASHRRLAAPYWSFWLSQQANPKTARALDIERASSSGMMEVQSKTFDRISFKWNGKTGAKLMVRFNCLSTDFSRIKGVKGIPLRVHMDTILDGIGGSHSSSASKNHNNTSEDQQGQSIERSFAKIKLFRDKGAERKNKDDHKHLEKMWDKMRGKNADTNPLVNMLAPVQSVSLFTECMDHPEGSGEDETLDLSETLALDSEADNGNGDDNNSAGDRGSSHSTRGGSENRLASPASGGGGGGGGGGDSVSSSSSLQHQSTTASKKRRRATADQGDNGHGRSGYGQQQPQQGDYGQVGFPLSSSGGATSTGGEGPAGSTELFLDRDPNYVPTTVSRKRRPVLCLYIKIGGETVYRAVYLEKFTLADLIQKLSEKLEIQSSTISCVYRKTNKKELMVRMDDAMVAQMSDELDMIVDYEFNQLDGSVNLTLKY